MIGVNQLYAGGSVGANVTGTGMVAGVWDVGQVRATHELLTGKVAWAHLKEIPDYYTRLLKMEKEANS